MPAVQSSIAAGLETRQASAILPALMAIVFGLLIVGTVGFSHIDRLHNAAHDVRHSSGFPCH